MIHRLLIVFCLISCLSMTAQAETPKKPVPALEMKWGRICVNKPLGEAEIKQIKETENWQTKGIMISKHATPAALASIAGLVELKKIRLDESPEIKSFKGVKAFAALEYLEVHRSFRDKSVFDCTDLASLKQLKEIDFSSVQMKNAAAIKACTKLIHVRLYMSPTDTLDFVEGTPDLEKLNLYGFKHSFPSYEPLAKLKKLKWLNVYMNKQAVDEKLKVLSALTSLEEFQMANCRKVTNINFLANCKGFKVLEATWCTKLTDISALAKMPELKAANLWDAGVTDLKPLSNCKKLERLNLKGTKITDLSPLSSCTALSSLDLTKVKVTNLKALAKCQNLQRLVLAQTPITDLSPLAKCPNLQSLDLVETSVTDISVLATFPKLRSLDLRKTKVTDLKPLYGVKTLTYITLSKTMPTETVDAFKKALPKCRISLR